MTPRLLVIDDDAVTRELLTEVLQDEGYAVEACESGKLALQRTAEDKFDLAITDVRMPEMDGIAVTQALKTRQPELQVIVMTAFGSVETAVEAIRHGAFDYVSKPMNLDEIKSTVRRALTERDVSGVATRRRTADRRFERRGRTKPGDGRGLPNPRPRRDLAQHRPDRGRKRHRQGADRRGAPSPQRPCERPLRRRRLRVPHRFAARVRALRLCPRRLHRRGGRKKGLFEEADGGTIFLDEIGDIGPSMQAKLLRVLQEYEIKRVGGQEWIRVDVRVVAATNRNLEQLVAHGTFREDLFYRLKVVTITLPPLRDRREDIPLLAEYFVRRHAARSNKPVTHLTPEAMGLLTEHPWPGNIRELEHCIERAVALASGHVLTPDDLAPELRGGIDATLFRGAPTLEEVKRRYLAHVLQETGGNISRAATILGVERRSLQRMLRRYGLRTS